MNPIDQCVDAPARSAGTEKIMSSVPAWFERKFEFSFAIDQYPNLCVRLRGTPARLEEMLREVPREVLVRKPGDKWSAQEHAGHLLDLEALWIARVGDFLTGRPELAAADLSNRKTHEANHNARRTREILADFRSARMELLNRVTKLQGEVLARSMLHPRLKQPMRLVDHLFFAAEHDDHHLAKIWELIKCLGGHSRRFHSSF
jgi:uncharacterized damage-inducible protein DinB